MRKARRSLPAEFDRALAPDLPFTALPDGDVYAPRSACRAGFPAARDPQSGRAWLTHCYGMVGAGRDNDADSGGGTELYVVIGHAPRHLDRNVTLLGRVVQGIELLVDPAARHGRHGLLREARAAHADPRDARRRRRAARRAHRSSRSCAPTRRRSRRWSTSRRNRREEWFKRPVGTDRAVQRAARRARESGDRYRNTQASPVAVPGFSRE